MKRTKLDIMTTAELVARYVEIGLAQYEAKEMDELAKYTRLFHQMMAIVRELKSRPGDQRHALTLLHHHPNAQVRLASAYATMAFTPAQSRAVFEDLVKKQEFPQALDAGMTLGNWDEAISKAT